MKYLLFSGSQEHWHLAIANQTWGVEPGSQPAKQFWRKIKTGDIAFFYAKEPVKGIIGFGILKETATSKVRIWSKKDYECRAPFEVCIHVLDGSKTPIGISDIKPHPQVIAAMNAVKPEYAEIIWQRIQDKWGVSEPSWLKRKTVDFRAKKSYVYLREATVLILGAILGKLFEIF